MARASTLRKAAGLGVAASIAAAAAASAQLPVGFRFPDWPLDELVRLVDANPGLRTLIVRDEDLALRAIQRLLGPPSASGGDEPACAAPPVSGSTIEISDAEERTCAVAAVIRVLQDNPALTELLYHDPPLAAAALANLFALPPPGRQTTAAVPPPADPLDRALLAGNPALDAMYQTSPEAVLSLIQLLRLASGSQ